MTPNLNLPAILIAIVWSGFTVWTMRTFWRKPSNVTDNSYHVMGKAWGIVGTVGSAFALPTAITFPGMPYWLEVAFLGFIVSPFAIIGGHFFGRCMQCLTERKTGK